MWWSKCSLGKWKSQQTFNSGFAHTATSRPQSGETLELSSPLAFHLRPLQPHWAVRLPFESQRNTPCLNLHPRLKDGALVKLICLFGLLFLICEGELAMPTAQGVSGGLNEIRWVNVYKGVDRSSGGKQVFLVTRAWTLESFTFGFYPLLVFPSHTVSHWRCPHVPALWSSTSLCAKQNPPQRAVSRFKLTLLPHVGSS